ncbi:MAG: HpcH/HpaI aldolase family protein [Luteibaculaceae bacterium]
MIGIFSKTTDSNFIEAAGKGGLDFIILDQEHGLATRENLSNHVRACQISGVKAIVRVKELNHNEIGSALDCGADGIQVPNVSNASEAALAIEAARFFPHGKRGVCRFVKAAEFGDKDKGLYFQDENKKLLILQVEGKEGFRQLDEILLLKGFDILFIGPYDLSQSLGYPGEIERPEVLEVINQISEKCKARNIRLGTFTDKPNQIEYYKKLGFKYIAYSVDYSIFLESCKTLVKQHRSA